jgi:hypothetical protein
VAILVISVSSRRWRDIRRNIRTYLVFFPMAGACWFFFQAGHGRPLENKGFDALMKNEVYEAGAQFRSAKGTDVILVDRFGTPWLYHEDKQTLFPSVFKSEGTPERPVYREYIPVGDLPAVRTVSHQEPTPHPHTRRR